jgi:hypothetical protein
VLSTACNYSMSIVNVLVFFVGRMFGDKLFIREQKGFVNVSLLLRNISQKKRKL